MGFWKKLYKGVKIGLAVAGELDGKQVEGKTIRIPGAKDAELIVTIVEAVVKDKLEKGDGGSPKS